MPCPQLRGSYRIGCFDCTGRGELFLRAVMKGTVRFFVFEALKAVRFFSRQRFQDISVVGMREALFVQYRELVHGCFPVVRGTLPTNCDVTQHQP